MAQSPSIPIYYFWNDNQAVLKSSFEATYQDDYPLVPIELRTEISTSNFGTTDFKNIIKEKVHRLIHEVISDNWNQYVIVSDIDIQFYTKIDTIIEPLVADQYDIVFQKEDGRNGINTGFVLMLCNEKVKDTWSMVYNTLAESPEDEFINEQEAMDTMFREHPPDVKWGLFPDAIWAFSNLPMPDNIVLHHANCTAPFKGKTSLQLKLEQFEQVREKVAKLAAQPGP